MSAHIIFALYWLHEYQNIVVYRVFRIGVRVFSVGCSLYVYMWFGLSFGLGLGFGVRFELGTGVRLGSRVEFKRYLRYLMRFSLLVSI